MFELEPAPARSTHVRPLSAAPGGGVSDGARAAEAREHRGDGAAALRRRLRIAGALARYAAATSAPRACEAEAGRRRRLEQRGGQVPRPAAPPPRRGAPQLDRVAARQAGGPPRDVSTAHVDVVNYPSAVLTLPWYEIVTNTAGDLSRRPPESVATSSSSRRRRRTSPSPSAA